jgi:hypothetical protein
MLPYQQRVVAEHAELTSKLDALRVFFGSDTSRTLPTYEHNLLKRQERAMTEYAEILRLRIECFTAQRK